MFLYNLRDERRMPLLLISVIGHIICITPFSKLYKIDHAGNASESTRPVHLFSFTSYWYARVRACVCAFLYTCINESKSRRPIIVIIPTAESVCAPQRSVAHLNLTKDWKELISSQSTCLYGQQSFVSSHIEQQYGYQDFDIMLLMADGIIQFWFTRLWIIFERFIL